MPRSSSDDETQVRSTRSRASSTRQRATRKRTTRQVEKRVEETTEETKPAPKAGADNQRKAPTGIGPSRASKKLKRNQLLIAVGVIVLGVGASAAVGFTDAGQIDVQKTIEARNERIRNNQANEGDTITSKIAVPVQDTKAQKADGGLRGLGTGGIKPAPPAPAATSTATSSDATASSTGNASSTPTELIEQEDAATSSVPTS